MTRLLPQSSTQLEHALAEACAFSGSPEKIKTLIDPMTCPLSFLPFLAWSVSVDEWDDAWPESVKRQVVADSYLMHKTSGTPFAVERVFQTIGFGEVKIEEGRAGYKRNGTMARDGFVVRGDPSQWYWYRVHLYKMLNNKQAERARRLLRRYGRLSTRLWELNFNKAALLHNGIAMRNGLFNRGVVNG